MHANPQTIPVESGVEATRRTPSRGVARLITYATGKEILIVGPSSAGKTKFAEYLRLGAMDPEGKREMTYHVSKSPAFAVRIGRQGGLILKVRRAVDTPGQVGPVQHASLVGRRRPHAVIVMLDCSKTMPTTMSWLHLFCNRLDTVLRRGSYLRRRLEEIVVLLNKRDKIRSKKAEQLRQNVQEAFSRHLSVVLGEERAHSIPILECISVRTRRGTLLIDDAITQLAERLAG